MDLSIDYRLVAWLRRGYRRKKVLNILDEYEEPITPTEISKSLKIQLVKVSVTLGELRKKRLVKCLNPEAPYTPQHLLQKDKPLQHYEKQAAPYA